MTGFGGVVAGSVIVVFAGLAYLIWYLRWEARHTGGMAYYGRPAASRRALKRRMRWLSLPAKPLVWVLSLLSRSRSSMPGFEVDGVVGPTRVSTAETFRRAQAYAPQPEDVFVVTQMRCGTTWMQQVVYQVVTRGQGDVGDQGHLYAMCPWIDGLNSVSIADAPLVGTPATRIVKSHLPALLCPYSADARYIYVARHPVSCFASIVDFNQSLSGPLVPPVSTLADWYCSDRMYWLPWPRHVDGWWRWAESRANVLFVHFEEMKSDFGAVLDRVTRFLGVALTPDERARVIERCSFAFMKDHEEFFEMAPPTMFSVTGGRFLASGRAARHDDVTPAVRDRITAYCRDALRDGAYPLERFYPDVASPRAG